MSAYKDKAGRWRYRFSRRGERYSGSTLTGHNTKIAALALERAHIERLERGVFTGTMPRVREFIAQFLEYQQAHTKPSTYASNKTILAIHVEPGIGTMPLDAVGAREIDRLVVAWTNAHAAPRTINLRLGVIARMYALAVEWKILAVAPDQKSVKVPKDTPRFLDAEEVARLLSACHHKWRTMMIVALRTGLRIGELRGLQWLDVNLERAIVRVSRTDPGTGAPATTPKSGKGRTIPLTPDALAALRDELELSRVRFKKEWSSDLPVWPGADNWKEQRDRMRTRSEGGCVNAITSALARAGIKDRPGDRLGWHTLRHTFASWLVARGVPLKVVQELLGHASIRQTERYAHLAPDAVHHSAVATLDFAVAPPTMPALPSGRDDDDGEE